MVEIDKSITKGVQTTVSITTDFKWIGGETEPTTPEGYVRASELDLDFGIMGKLWGFVKVN